jgi:hypothetical protein
MIQVSDKISAKSQFCEAISYIPFVSSLATAVHVVAIFSFSSQLQEEKNSGPYFEYLKRFCVFDTSNGGRFLSFNYKNLLIDAFPGLKFICLIFSCFSNDEYQADVQKPEERSAVKTHQNAQSQISARQHRQINSFAAGTGLFNHTVSTLAWKDEEKKMIDEKQKVALISASDVAKQHFNRQVLAPWILENVERLQPAYRAFLNSDKTDEDWERLKGVVLPLIPE